MRVSTYVIAAPLEGEPYFLLMHGYSGALDKVSADLGQLLLDHRGEDIDLNRISPALHSRLADRGYITERSREEEIEVFRQIAATLHEQSLIRHTAAFVIIPSYQCNLRCPYCWQSTEMHMGAGAFSALLDRQQIDDIFAVVDQFRTAGAVARALGASQEAAPTEHLSHEVTLFGGEPLLASTLPAVTAIVEECRKRDMRLSAITNGVELEHFSALLGASAIEEVQITLDGPASAHDRRRIGPEHRQTFQRIADNIQLALDHDVQVNVRINVDRRNASEFLELEDYFAARGWSTNSRFISQAAAVHGGSTRPSEARHRMPSSDLVQIVTPASREEDNCIESFEYQARQILKSSLATEHYPYRRSSFCSAEAGMLIFDPLGDVYACWEDAGVRKHRIGEYGAGRIRFLHEEANQWLSRFPGAIEECSACPYGLIHVSGCASEARRSAGTLFAPSCQSFQDYFPRMLADAYQDMERQILAHDFSAKPAAASVTAA